jgi:hypothetical protein
MKINYKELAKEKATNKNKVEEGLIFDDFLAACYVKCSPQSYGPKIEKRVIQEFGFKKIPQKKGEGDLLSSSKNIFPHFDFPDGSKSEFKISFLSADKSWNLIQLRPYENFDFYVFLLVNPYNLCSYEWFVIRKDDINNSNFKLNSIHGTKESNKKNKNIEYKLMVESDSKSYNKLKELNLIKNV